MTYRGHREPPYQLQMPYYKNTFGSNGSLLRALTCGTDLNIYG